MERVIVTNEAQAVPCRECGRDDVMTVGSPGSALCEPCWSQGAGETPIDRDLLVEGLSSAIRCPVCVAAVRRG